MTKLVSIPRQSPGALVLEPFEAAGIRSHRGRLSEYTVNLYGHPVE
jgi:hypothetical protein